jgi:hypothetical protein
MWRAVQLAGPAARKIKKAKAATKKHVITKKRPAKKQ